MATPDSRLLHAAQTSSPSTMSSSAIGALSTASQVFWTCIREKAE
jgi:hypothetical protein